MKLSWSRSSSKLADALSLINFVVDDGGYQCHFDFKVGGGGALLSNVGVLAAAKLG